jgi:hypothetical protein
MIVYSDEIIPKYLQETVSLKYEILNPTVQYRNRTIVDCKTIQLGTDPTVIQSIINDYRKYDTSNTIYLFLITDYCVPHNVPNNMRLYRTSILKSYMSPNEYILPYLWEHIPIAFTPLRRTTKPIVAFCGLVSPYRIKTLQLFESDDRIETDYIFRDLFWGGKPQDPQIIDDFRENMKEAHFNICNRGKGNFSMRFYQTLSAGRIPILLNTDMVLPLADVIPWNSIIVIANTEEELVKKTILFWNTRNIEEAQRKCREIHDTYFTGTKYLNGLISGEYLT